MGETSFSSRFFFNVLEISAQIQKWTNVYETLYKILTKPYKIFIIKAQRKFVVFQNPVIILGNVKNKSP